MDTCQIPKLLEEQERLNLHSIVSFFNQHYPDEYINHLIEDRGIHHYERIRLGQRGPSQPCVVIHNTGGFAVIVAPSGERESHKPYAETHLGKVTRVLFFETQDPEGKVKHYIELHDNSAIIKIEPTRFSVFSADFCQAFADTKTE